VVAVTNPRRPFRLNVGFLLNQPVGYSHEFPFSFDQIQIPPDLDLRHFEGVATMGRTPQGLIVQGDFTAEITLSCVRCLNDFWQQIHFDLTELYAFRKKDMSESGLLLPDDAHIDLQPLVREYALLEVPISPICKPDCKGLCPECGEDLNVTDCGHRVDNGDSPFSVLKDLLNN
jgi:uncharacterized protein